MAGQPTTPIDRDPARLSEALPWYRNGTLTPEDHAWVEAQLQSWAEGQLAEDLSRELDRPTEAEFDAMIEAEFEARIAELPADIGWERLLARVRTDSRTEAAGTATTAARAAPAANAAGAATAPTSATAATTGTTARADRAAGSDDVTPRAFAAPVEPSVRRPAQSRAGTPPSSALDRFAAWFGSLLTPQFGMAMAALLVAQAGLIGWLAVDHPERGDTVAFRAGPGAEPVETIRALLQAQTTEQALRDALLANQAVIIDGPNALGEYWILAPGRPAEAVASAMRDAGVIASFAIDHRPRVR